MASRVGLILRTTAARQRSDAAIAHLFASEDLGDLTPAPPMERDVEVAAMLREEWLADVMEALAFGPPVSEEVEDAEGEQGGDATDVERVEVPTDQELVGEEGEVVDLEQSDDNDVDADPEANDEPQIDRDALFEMSLADLKERAINRGVDAGVVTKMRSRKEVVAAMYPELEGEG